MLKDYILQELHVLLAVHCRELVMVGKANGAKTEQQIHYLSVHFHGSDDGHVSVLDLMMQGKAPYDKMFDRQAIHNNREGNEHRVSSGVMLELLPFFHCDQGTSVYVHDDGYSRECLSMNKGEKVSGRNISDRALCAIANYKYALKFYHEYAQTTDDESNPSGRKTENMLLYV